MSIVQFIYPGGRFNATAIDLKYLIEWAYGILPAQLSGGPLWLSEDRYDIAAKPEGDATDAQIKRMTQALLEDRFKLKFHRETKEAPVLIVTLGKNPPKLFPPKDGERQSIRIVPRTADGQKASGYRIVATRFSFEQLNQTLARHLERVIVNQTGLEGDYDFEFELTPDENTPSPLDPTLVISALRDQLGFNVKSVRAPVESLVIDNVEKVAAGN